MKEDELICPVCDSSPMPEWDEAEQHALQVCPLCDFSWKDEAATQRANAFHRSLRKEEEG